MGTIKSKSDTRTVHMKSGGMSDVCDVILYDETGEVELSLWDEHVLNFHNGDKVEIINGFLGTFQGKTRLNVGKFGVIRKIE